MASITMAYAQTIVANELHTPEPNGVELSSDISEMRSASLVDRIRADAEVAMDAGALSGTAYQLVLDALYKPTEGGIAGEWLRLGHGNPHGRRVRILDAVDIALPKDDDTIRPSELAKVLAEAFGIDPRDKKAMSGFLQSITLACGYIRY